MTVLIPRLSSWSCPCSLNVIVTNRKIFFWVLTFALQVGMPSLTRVSKAQDQSLEPLSQVVDANVHEFYEEIEKEAKVFYEANKELLPNVPADRWDRMVRLSVLRMEQMGLGAKAMAQYAKPAAGTFVVTNILSTFVLPPILTSVGQPGLAMLVLATPFEPFVAAGQVFVMKSWSDVKLIKKIGIKEFRNIQKLRTELLGMAERSHVISLMHEDFMKEMLGLSIGVTSKEYVGGLNVSVSELEALVLKDSNGARWLDKLLPLKNKKSLYTLELWMFIQERPELRRELLQTLRTRFAKLGTHVNLQKLSSQLHEIIDLKKVLLGMDNQLGALSKENSRHSTQAEKKALKQLVADATTYSNEILRMVSVRETEVLTQIVHGDKESATLVNSMLILRDSVRKYKQAISMVERFDQDRLVTPQAIRDVFGPSFGEPLKTRANSSRSCSEILINLLSRT